jgi:hypothetical protein
VFTVLAVRRNSPCNGRPSISIAIVFDRSPFATAPITRAISLVGCTRSAIKPFTDPMASPQQSETSPSEARCEIRPSLPTTCPIRSSSRASR